MYVLYMAVDKLVIRWALSSDHAHRYQRVFNVLIIVGDFAYIPIAITYGLCRIAIWIGFALLSYVRPDINIYPRGLESWDMGHVTFVATITMMLQREAEYAQMFGHDIGKQDTKTDGKDKYVRLVNSGSIGMQNEDGNGDML